MVVVVALAARVGVYGGGWLAVTADSPSFVAIAGDLLAGDLSDPRLGTVRLPGYPFFLAALDARPGLSATLVVLAQALLGVAAAAAGAIAGMLLGSRALAYSTGLTLALHPALLVFEHSLMAETLAVALSTIFLAVLIGALRARSLATLVFAGALAGATLLTRLNLLPLILVAVAGALLGERFLSPAARPFEKARWALALAAGLALAVAPWVAHLWRAQSAIAFFPGGEKLRLANAIELGLVTEERLLEHLGPVEPGAVSPGSAYLKKLTLGPGTGEAEARRVLRASFHAAPGRFARAAAECSLSALGWLRPRALGAANDLPSWLDEAESAKAGERSVARQQVARLLDAAALEPGRPPRFELLRAARGGGLPSARGVLLGLGCVLVLLGVGRAGWGLRPQTTWLLVGLLAVEALLAASFAASLVVRQRFAFPLDWVAVGIFAVAAASRFGPRVREPAETDGAQAGIAGDA